MPELVRLYIRHTLIGFGLSAVFVAMLLGFDVAHLRHLIFASGAGYLALLLLVVFNGIVFSGVQFGIAVMRMAEPEGGDRGGCRPVAAPAPMPVRVPVPASKERRRGA